MKKNTFITLICLSLGFAGFVEADYSNKDHPIEELDAPDAKRPAQQNNLKNYIDAENSKKQMVENEYVKNHDNEEFEEIEENFDSLSCESAQLSTQDQAIAFFKRYGLSEDLFSFDLSAPLSDTDILKKVARMSNKSMDELIRKGATGLNPIFRQEIRNFLKGDGGKEPILSEETKNLIDPNRPYIRALNSIFEIAQENGANVQEAALLLDKSRVEALKVLIRNNSTLFHTPEFLKKIRISVRSLDTLIRKKLTTKLKEKYADVNSVVIHALTHYLMDGISSYPGGIKRNKEYDYVCEQEEKNPTCDTGIVAYILIGKL